MASNIDQSLYNITKKFQDFLESQQGQELRIEKISSFVDSIRELSVKTPPLDKLQVTDPQKLRQLLVSLSGYLGDSVLCDTIYKTVIRIFATISFALTNREEVVADLFSKYFFENTHKDLTSALDLLFYTLREFPKINLQFWWYLLCKYKDGNNEQYFSKLREFFNMFIKTPSSIISIQNLNTFYYILHLFKEEQSRIQRIMIIRNSLLSSLQITPKFIDDSHTLSSIAVLESNNDTVSKKILLEIYKQGKTIFIEVLKIIIAIIDDMDISRNGIPSATQDVSDEMQANSGLYELLRMRYITSLLLTICPTKEEFDSIYDMIISEMRIPNKKLLFIFATQLDSHRNKVIIDNINDPEYRNELRSFIGHLSVIFSPLFLHIQEKEIIAFSDSCKNRNKRLKTSTPESKFLEEVSKICIDPMRFENFLYNLENGQCHFPPQTASLLLNAKTGPKWTYEEALQYLLDLINVSTNDEAFEGELLNIVISRLSIIQSHLVNQGLGINHHFLAEQFFDRCIKALSPLRLKTAFLIVNSSSLVDDFTEKQRLAWIEYVHQGLTSTTKEINETASGIVLHCLTHFTKPSFCLCKPFIDANPKPSIDYITTLLSIYSICFNSDIEDREQIMETILKHVDRFVSEMPRDEVSIGMLTTLLFEELSNESSQVISPQLVTIIDKFLARDESQTDSIPPAPLRMFNLFPMHYEVINKKYPTFFDHLIDCIVNIINNNKTDTTLVQLLTNTLIDTIIRTDDPGHKLATVLDNLELIKKLREIEKSRDNSVKSQPANRLSTDELTKCFILRTAIDQFMARMNEPFNELVVNKTLSSKNTDETDGIAYIINQRYSLLKVLFNDKNEKSFNIAAKTMTGSYNYKIEQPQRVIVPNPTPVNEQINFEQVAIPQSEFNKSFDSFASEYASLDSAAINSFEQELENLVRNSEDSSNASNYTMPFDRPFTPPTSISLAVQSHDDNDLDVLYPSHDATSFIESLTCEGTVIENAPTTEKTQCPIMPQNTPKVPSTDNLSSNWRRASQLNVDDSLDNLNHFNAMSRLVIKKPFPLLNITSSNIFATSIRETLKIGFLYVKKGQTDQNSILQNSWSQVTDDFRSFVGSIGEIIDLSTHQGFAGKLDNTGFSNGRYQLYFATDHFEVMYHVAPLLPTDPNDVQQIYKKRHIGNDNVHVVWSENTFDYEPTTITSQFNDAHIIVYPIESTSQFFRVVVYRKSKDYHFGPLQGDSVVSAKALPHLVRWTSIFSDRVSREMTSTSYKLPTQLLRESIRDSLRIKDNQEE